MMNDVDTICAIATPNGIGAISVIRVSGKKSFEIIDGIFTSKSKKKIFQTKTHTLHFGTLQDKEELIDEVLISVFKNPTSYTGEDSIEISCHSSPYIIQKILQLLIKKGARLANAGEFTQRAFLNGKLDLIQAESVADLIASNSEASHRIAINQMKGNFSKDLYEIREKLISFTALIELELDFSEEDVEFANREQLIILLNELEIRTSKLVQSFKLGNAIKNGVPVAIVGRPNAGKSTLLNALLNEERAIVSKIAGTTRDTIEEVYNVNGISFRFIDTAGIRATTDEIESLGIEKSFKKAKSAEIIVYLFDSKTTTKRDILDDIKVLENSNAHLIVAQNKIDENKKITISANDYSSFNFLTISLIDFSAKKKLFLDELKKLLISKILDENYLEANTIVSNVRHIECLTIINKTIPLVLEKLENKTSSELISFELKEILNQIGKLTGKVDIDEDILGTIFGKFCIGK